MELNHSQLVFKSFHQSRCTSRSGTNRRLRLTLPHLSPIPTRWRWHTSYSVCRPVQDDRVYPCSVYRFCGLKLPVPHGDVTMPCLLTAASQCAKSLVAAPDGDAENDETWCCSKVWTCFHSVFLVRAMSIGGAGQAPHVGSTTGCGCRRKITVCNCNRRVRVEMDLTRYKCRARVGQ